MLLSCLPYIAVVGLLSLWLLSISGGTQTHRKFQRHFLFETTIHSSKRLHCREIDSPPPNVRPQYMSQKTSPPQKFHGFFRYYRGHAASHRAPHVKTINRSLSTTSVQIFVNCRLSSFFEGETLRFHKSCISCTASRIKSTTVFKYKNKCIFLAKTRNSN